MGVINSWGQPRGIKIFVFFLVLANYFCYRFYYPISMDCSKHWPYMVSPYIYNTNFASLKKPPYWLISSTRSNIVFSTTNL